MISKGVPSEPSESGLVTYRHILVGYDGSKNGDRALVRATELAKEAGATLIIIVVVNTTISSFSPVAPALPPSVFDQIVQDGKDALARAVSTAKETVRDVSGVLADGYAAEEILRVADENKADLIVLGRRGISAVERFLLGGVSSSVVGHSKCDVIIVK